SSDTKELRCAARGGRREIIKLECRQEEEHNEPTCHARNDRSVAAVCGNCPASGCGIGYAEQRSDSDNVNAAVNAFHAALSNLDIGKMQNVWAQEPYVVLINPRDKAPAVGWDAVKKDWQTGVIGFWAELKLSPKQTPQIHVDQTTAWTTGVVGVEGKNKSGQALSFTIIETQVYEKRGDRWLMVSHHASRVPE